MKIQTLNTWGGRIYQPLIDHVIRQSKTVDIFCFQEIYDSNETTITRGVNKGTELTQDSPARANLYTELTAILEDFQGIFHPVIDNHDAYGSTTTDLHFGQATFIRKSIIIERTGELFVYRNKNDMILDDLTTHPRNIEYISFQYNKRPILLVNFHGIHGNGKIDTVNRLSQAKKIRSFLKRQKGAKIVCGDFNLRIDTQSLAIIGDGMDNLIKKYGMSSTRSSYYKKPERFADYILVSPEIRVSNFRVIPDEVSDHLGLEVTIQ